MQKSCGNCVYWVKLKRIIGLCDKFDYSWCPSDHKCADWRKLREHKKPKHKKPWS